MIGALNTKLLRDLWSIKGQMAAIALVMAAGIAVYVITFGVLDSLKLTKETYYDRYQFADVFVSLKRAPLSVSRRIQEIPGVSIAQTRVVFGVTLQMSGMDEPASGKVISIPDNGPPLLNKLYLRSGRMLKPNEESSVIVDESFFEAHALSLGDNIAVIMNGHKRQLQVVGVGLSPEYVYSIAPGALMPDSKRYGVFWMSRRSLEAAVNMKGAFNDVSLKLSRSANQAQVKERLDALLKPYGGLIAYGREDQISNFFVENELKQLQSMGAMAPMIFLGVAAFLINVVMSRQIATQREQIGMLKAVGYGDWQISVLFLKMVLVVTVAGAIVGLSLGAWLGSGMTKMYTEFFHFPILHYHFSPSVAVFSVLFCCIAAVTGTVLAIRSAAKLPPAEAMRPEAPAEFKATVLERLHLHEHLSFLSRIILRQLERRPLRAFLSALGTAFALSILIFSFFMEDSMTHLLNVQYDVNQREDLSLSFIEPTPTSALEEIRAMPGVTSVEPLRSVAVGFSNGHRYKRGSITGMVPDPDLRRITDAKLRPVMLPGNGLVLSSKLAEILSVSVGDIVTTEVLEGRRQVLKIPVVDITQEFIGMGAYTQLSSLNKLLDEPPTMTEVALLIDDKASATLYRRLKSVPAIMGLNINSVLREIFEELMAENILKMVGINVLFASIISFGVIYNTARIALSERGRELASLRVLGLTRREVAYILFGELAFITVVAIPMGMWLGLILAVGMVSSMDSELFRIPVYIENSTYGAAALIVMFSALLSCYLVWRQIDKIDLVSAQKGVE